MPTHAIIEPFSYIWWQGIVSCIIVISSAIFFFKNKAFESKHKLNQYLAYLAFVIYLVTIGLAVYADEWTITDFLPLHLCSFSYFISILLLIYKKQWMFEWALMIAVPSAIHAILTPELYMGFSNWYLFDYYFMHGFLILVPLYLISVLNYKIRFFSWWKTLLRAQFIMIFVYFINLILKTNYMFLITKPSVNNLLLIGDWPFYILYAELFAILHVVVIYKLSPKHV